MAKTLAKVLKTDISRLPLRKAAEELRKKGRGRDTVLAHITPKEAAMLKARGGAGTINPETGLPEFEGADTGFDFTLGSTDQFQPTGPITTDQQFQPFPTSTSAPALTPTEMRDIASGLQADYNYQVGNQAQFGAAPGQDLWSNYFTSGSPQDYYTNLVGQQFAGGEIPYPVARPDALGAIAAAAPGETIPANALAFMPDTAGKTADQVAAEEAGARGDMTVKQQDTTGKAAGTVQTPFGNIATKDLIAALGVGGLGLNYLRAQQQGKSAAQQLQNAYNTAAQQQTQLAQPFMQQGGTQLAQALTGALSPAQQQQLQAGQAQAAQQAAASGGVAAQQAQRSVEDLRQRLLANQQQMALSLLGAGTPLINNAISQQLAGTTTGINTQMALSQQAGQAATGMLGMLASLYGRG